MIPVWSANASSAEPGELERHCEAWLTTDEVERANRFRVLTARNQHVVGRGMARRLLVEPTLAECPSSTGRQSSGVRVHPTEIVFSFTRYGKPVVVAPQPLVRPFNVAHTDGMVLFVAGDLAGEGGTIGIDVERVHRRTDVALAERYFAKPEVEYVLDHHDPDVQRIAFLRVWTLKESFIKAIGTGLTMPLADFAFENIDQPRPQVRMLNPALDDGRAWQFVTFAPQTGFVAAVAVCAAKPTAEPEVELRRFESFLSQSKG